MHLINRLSVWLVCLCLTGGIQAKKLPSPSAGKYTVVYTPSAETGIAQKPAMELARKLTEMTGNRIAVAADTLSSLRGKRISLQWEQTFSPFAYRVDANRKFISIKAGGEWAMEYAASLVADRIAGKTGFGNYTLEGTVEGKMLFPRRRDVNLRILVDNIWDYSAETLPKAWEQAGIDCRDKHRAPQFAQMVRAYMPDVLALQEYNRHMHNEFYPLIQAYGYEIAYDSGDGPWNNTPLFFLKDSVELKEVKYHLYTPEQWCNAGTKSFAWAVFRQKSTGTVFALMNTHLWWKSDKAQPGSTMARAAQIRLLMADAEIIRQKYDCPIFVVGDMNSEEPSVPIQQFLQAGYLPCHSIATVYANKDNGHHVCSPSEVGRRESKRKSVKREVGAIDHCLLYNAKEGDEVKVFDCIQSYFTVLLTDHYPNLIDAALKR